jgi:hypothetical protein
VRLLQAGDTSKNDPNDAFLVAVAALRPKVQRPVIADDHAAVLKVWAKRHRDLARSRNQAACRLHAVLCDPEELGGELAARLGNRTRWPGPLEDAGGLAGGDLLADAAGHQDICRLDAQLRQANKKLAAAVRARRTSQTGSIIASGGSGRL